VKQVYSKLALKKIDETFHLKSISVSFRVQRAFTGEKGKYKETMGMS
jgi:hypothetical protein